MSTILDSINRYAVSGEAESDAYAGLRDHARSILSAIHSPEEAATTFSVDCVAGEREFMELNYANDPNAKHDKGKRVGQWKYRTFLPRSYVTAKSVLVNALKKGIHPADMGKSALEKLIKGDASGAGKGASNKTPEQNVEQALQTLLKRYNALTQAQKDYWCDIVADAFGLTK